jgi:DNA-binding SARP family transcriptional activator
MLSILLLGQPQILRDGKSLNVARRKSRALVYYLAAHPRPLSREHLLAFFWPDLDRPAARQTLRTTLHGLRKALGGSLVVEDDTIALNADVDARRFEAHLSSIQLPITNPQSPTSNLQSSQTPEAERRGLISNLHLYRADFLDGFTLPGSPAFDDWATVERERYRRLAVRGLTQLSGLHEADGNFTAALDALDRALAFDALQEDLQRAAMRLHYLAGDRAGAIRRYDSLRRLLDEEMGVPPMAETRAVYDAIIKDKLQTPKIQTPGTARELLRDATPTLPHPHTSFHRVLPSPLPFTGRDAELQTLRALAASHRLALIEGEPGIGKTRLAQEFINAENPIALVGVAHELEQALPYQPVIEALRCLLTRADWPALLAALRASLPAVWLAEIARLLPELGTRPPEPLAASPADESRLWEGLHQFLLALAAQHPVALFLDDLQWADASTLALLGYLARQAASAPIFYLAAMRSAPPRSPLAALVQTLTRENRLTRLALQRLSADDVTAIARQLNPAEAGALADWLSRASEGNPYVLAELIRHAVEHNLLEALSVMTAPPILPQSVYSLIQSRLSRLSDPARRVLDAAVAAGREFEFDVVYRAAGLSEAAALDALDELRLAALVQPAKDDPTGRLYTFDHTLTMEVAYREVGEARHRLLHHRIAETLESLPGRRRPDSAAGVIASHFIEGNDLERAAPYAFCAGRQAAGLAAWKEAIAFYEQALAAQIDDDQRRQILMELGEARFRAGEGAQASDAFRSALALSRPDSVQADEARLALAQSFLTQARFAETIELLRQVRAVGRPEHAIEAQFIRGTALSIEGADLQAAAEHLQDAEALLDQLGERADLTQRSKIKFEIGSVAAQQGDLPQAIALYRESLALAEQADTPAAGLRGILARNNLAYHLHLLGDPGAGEYARAGLALAQQTGELAMQTFLLSTLGEIALAAEGFDEAERYFEDGLALAERLSIPERIAGLTANLGLLARARGETDLAIHHLSTALARADSLGLRHLAAQTRLWLAPLLPPAEARARLAEARVIAEASGRRRLLEEVKRLSNL